VIKFGLASTDTVSRRARLALRYMVSTIKEGMGGAKSDYLQNHTFKSPVTRTDTRS
jgi:hypothetical protein